MSGKFTTALYINKFSSATHIGKGTLAAFSEHIKGIVGMNTWSPSGRVKQIMPESFL